MSEGREWVLVVDDDPIVTRSIEMLLGEETDWKIVSFNDAASALRAVREQSFDVVLSDFLMPGMDGVEFLTLVREAQPEATRVLLTGYADKKNAIRAINEAGLFHYVEKPWDNDALLMVLRNACERSRLLRDLERRMRELDDRHRSLDDLRRRLFKALL